jgi:hypothetical protein
MKEDAKLMPEVNPIPRVSPKADHIDIPIAYH